MNPSIQVLLSTILAAVFGFVSVKSDNHGGGDDDATTEAPHMDGEGLANRVFMWIREYPEYTVMIGMGAMILMLVITAICLICCLSGRNKE